MQQHAAQQHGGCSSRIVLPYPPLLQATQTYANKLGPLVEAGNATEEESAEGIAFFRTIAPLVSQVSEEDAAAITAALATPTNSTGTTVGRAASG